MPLKYFSIIFLFCASFVHAKSFEEGKHYQVLAQPISEKKEVREYFSFYCPHCFSQEPLMKEITAALPEGVKFQKNHVDGMPGQNIEVEQSLSKALIAAQLLKVEQQLVPQIFAQIHVEKQPFKSVAEVKDLFVKNGIDADTFDKAMKNYSLVTRFKAMNRNTEKLRSQGVTGVPTLIINGKYRPLTSDIKSVEEYKALVIHLLDKEA